ncbi:hypothetical protein [Mycobacterium sp. URHB0021]
MSDMREVHEWCLHRGLPLVLTRRVRSRSLIERSAPTVGGVAAPFALHLLHRSGTTLGAAGRRSAALLVMALFVFGSIAL